MVAVGVVAVVAVGAVVGVMLVVLVLMIGGGYVGSNYIRGIWLVVIVRCCGVVEVVEVAIELKLWWAIALDDEVVVVVWRWY